MTLKSLIELLFVRHLKEQFVLFKKTSWQCCILFNLQHFKTLIRLAKNFSHDNKWKNSTLEKININPNLDKKKVVYQIKFSSDNYNSKFCTHPSDEILTRWSDRQKYTLRTLPCPLRTSLLNPLIWYHMVVSDYTTLCLLPD